MASIGLTLQHGRSQSQPIVDAFDARVVAAGGTVEGEVCANSAISKLLGTPLEDGGTAYSEASLLNIPSGYKVGTLFSQKPTDGAGDLTFARNSNATRVNSAGLIEKVRTNIALFSEQFDNGFYIKLGTSFTVTANTTTAPNGTLTADTLNVSNNDNVLYAARSGSLPGNEYTFSIYAKGTGNFSMNIRLNSLTTTTETKTLTSDWQRFSVSVTNAVPVVSVEFYLDLNTSSTYNVWGAQVETGPVATDYIATPTSSDVSVGITADIPRIDYTGGGCPSLLLEPQRTNLLTYSEQFDNAAWTKLNVTVSGNVAQAPDGAMTADLIYPTSSGNDRFLEGVVFGETAGIPYTNLFFVKESGFEWVLFLSPHLRSCWFNLITGQFGTIQAGLTANLVGIFNGYYAIYLTDTGTPTTKYYYVGPVDANGSNATTANGTDGILLWGAQMEAGSYPTSYIPTLGSSVTRLADVALTASVPSLIGQTEGTLFIEFERINLFAGSWFILSNLAGTTANSYFDSIYFFQLPNGIFVVEAYISNVQQFAFSGAGLSISKHKIAIGYKANDFVLYIDGVQIGTDTSGSVPAMNFLTIGGGADGGAQSQNVNIAAVYPTRLSNAELQSLTSL